MDDKTTLFWSKTKFFWGKKDLISTQNDLMKCNFRPEMHPKILKISKYP